MSAYFVAQGYYANADSIAEKRSMRGKSLELRRTVKVCPLVPVEKRGAEDIVAAGIGWVQGQAIVHILRNNRPLLCKSREAEETKGRRPGRLTREVVFMESRS